MQAFYTSVTLKKNIITEFWIDEKGRRKKTTSKFKPTLAIETNKKEKYKSIFGNTLGKIQFDSCVDMYLWKKENKKYTKIYDDIGPIYEYISNKYSEDLQPDFTKLKIFNIDIECISNESFPFPDVAKYPINSIAVQDYYKDLYYVFACNDYKVKDDNVTFFKCEDEFDLCAKFLEFFRKSRPDVITGFNTMGFDIPYIVNRFKQVLPDGEYYRLSPVDEIRPITEDGKVVGYNLVGIAHLDFMVIYKDMNLKKLEAYSLENISQEELGEGKIDFKSLGYKNHYDFYVNDFDKFIDYNLLDVNLVSRINKKKRFIEIILAQAYMSKVNIQDAMGSVKPWDCYIYNELKKENILASPKSTFDHEEIPGGFVLEPTPGMHENLLVVDIKSSYPNNIISANLSPETHVSYTNLPKELLDFREEVKREFWGTKEKTSTGFIDIDNIPNITKILKENKLCMSPNGEFFRSDIEGILPKIVSKIYNQRKAKKAEMKSYWNEIKEKKEKLKELEIELEKC